MPSPSRSTVVVPNLVGLSEAGALSVLNVVGFSKSVRQVQVDPQAEAGTVLSQSPSAGQAVPADTSITYSISAAPEPSSQAEPTPVPATTLLGYVPQAWRAACHLFKAPLVLLDCYPTGAGTDLILSLVMYDPANPSPDGKDEFTDYEGFFTSDDGTPACPDDRLDGDLSVGDRTIGVAGGCTNDNWFGFRLDAEHVVGVINASNYADARAVFVKNRLFPKTYSGTISGVAFGPVASPTSPPTFASLKADSNVVTYSELVHDNTTLHYKQVYFKGEVLQYTTDASIPFSVLVDVTQGVSGLYIGGPIALASYTGEPLAQGDSVEFVGTVGPMVTYESVGGSKTIPTVIVIALRTSP